MGLSLETWNFGWICTEWGGRLQLSWWPWRWGRDPWTMEPTSKTPSSDVNHTWIATHSARDVAGGRNTASGATALTIARCAKKSRVGLQRDVAAMTDETFERRCLDQNEVLHVERQHIVISISLLFLLDWLTNSGLVRAIVLGAKRVSCNKDTVTGAGTVSWERMSLLDLGLIKSALRHENDLSLPWQRVLQKPLEDTHLLGSGQDLNSSLATLLIQASKTAGALLRPKGMTKYS